MKKKVLEEESEKKTESNYSVPKKTNFVLP